MRLAGRVVVWGAPLAAAALLAAGCGYGGTANAGGAAPDTTRGQQLFSSTCGGCHTLVEAGTAGTIGPNLDDAFAADKAQGYATTAIANVVLDQIRLGSGPILAPYKTEKRFTSKYCLNPKTKPNCYATPMPSNLLTGQDAIDVAAYVASVAGTSTATTNFASLGTNGAAIFKGAGCAGCHTLKAAGSTGTIGPDLDSLAANLTLAIVVRQVTTPPPGLMPSFKGKLTAAQIQAVAKYVTSVAGK